MPDTLQPGNHIKFLVAVVHINWYSIRFGKSIESTISEIDKTLLRENNNQESIQKHTTNVLIILGGGLRGAITRRTTQGIAMSGVAMFKRTLKKESTEITRKKLIRVFKISMLRNLNMLFICFLFKLYFLFSFL